MRAAARCEELLWAEVASRARAGSLKWQFDIEPEQASVPTAWPGSTVWRGARGWAAPVMTRGALPPRLACNPLRRAPAGKLRVPADAPSALLNRVSVGLFNALCHRRGRARAVRGAAGTAALLERAAAAGRGSFLAVLKLFGPAGDGLMSFPMEGYTLALDFPLRDGTAALLDGLDEITHRHGGRVYLAKDARCAPERVREGYPRLGAFEAVRAEAAGAPPRFASELSRRLAL